MTKQQFKKRMLELGFVAHPVLGASTRFSRLIRQAPQHVALASVRATGWRLFMAVGRVPDDWPLDDRRTPETDWQEAESPWFEYLTDSGPQESEFDDRDTALQKCFDWLTTVGMQWLTDPDVRDREQWRREFDIIVRPPC